MPGTDNQMTMDDFNSMLEGIQDTNDVDNSDDAGASTPDTGAADTDNQSDSTNDNAQTQTQAQTDNNDADNTGDKPAGTQHTRKSMNDTFAAMRVQNKTYQDALAAVLAQHGMDPALAKNPMALIKEAEDAALEKEAEKQKVPTELLARLTQLEKTNIQREQERLSNLALAGFQAVKEKYNLTPEEVANFARQLQEAGTNPFEKEMDLDTHYRLHNIDAIIQKETKKAVEEALRNQTNASTHSTKPSKTQGKKESAGVDRIDTMAQFDRYLQTLK